MMNELDALEAKIARVVTLCHELRGENRLLQQRIAVLEHDKQELQARMNDACLRLESLMTQLPEETVK